MSVCLQHNAVWRHGNSHSILCLKMPLLVQEDLWEETLSQISIFLPLKNVARKTVDVLSTPRYLKVSYPPYLFEKFLFAEINDRDSCTQITDSQIVLKLAKSHPTTWNSIAHAQSEDRSVMRAVRQEASHFLLQRSLAEREERKVTRQESHKFALNEHMDAETARIRAISTRKEQEKMEALASFDFREELTTAGSCEKNAENKLEKQIANNQLLIPDEALEELLQEIAKVDQKQSAILVDKNNPKISCKEELAKGPSAVRSLGTITFTATPRPFPTPQRESQVAEEESWLQKQSNYRQVLQATGGNPSRKEEDDPVWLKGKGDFLLDVGDHHSAIACYNRAVQLGCSMPEIYMNRGLAHLLKNNLHKVLEDMSRALAILPVAGEVAKKERMKAYWRRAVAFFKLQLFVESLIELNGAAEIDPGEDFLQRQRVFVKGIVEGSVSENEADGSWMFCGLVLHKS